MKADDFKIEKGEDNLSDYTWTPPRKSKANLHYRFCETCGVRTFAQGDKEPIDKLYAVFIAALDDIGKDADQIAKSVNMSMAVTTTMSTSRRTRALCKGGRLKILRPADFDLRVRRHQPENVCKLCGHGSQARRRP